MIDCMCVGQNIYVTTNYVVLVLSVSTTQNLRRKPYNRCHVMAYTLAAKQPCALLMVRGEEIQFQQRDFKYCS